MAKAQSGGGRETRGKPAEITDSDRDSDTKANYSSHEYSEAQASDETKAQKGYDGGSLYGSSSWVRHG